MKIILGKSKIFKDERGALLGFLFVIGPKKGTQASILRERALTDLSWSLEKFVRLLKQSEKLVLNRDYSLESESTLIRPLAGCVGCYVWQPYLMKGMTVVLHWPSRSVRLVGDRKHTEKYEKALKSVSKKGLAKGEKLINQLTLFD